MSCFQGGSTLSRNCPRLSAVVSVYRNTAGVGESSLSELPKTLALEVPYPNPFNRETAISFCVAGQEKISLTVYSLEGRLIATIADGFYEPGSYTARWDGRNYLGAKVSSGIYLVRLTSSERQQTRKLCFLQ